MKQLLTTGIILRRTDYGEADRILTVLTPDKGKLRLMARGVRKVKSKLAGGIELFSTSNITYIAGKGEVGTLVSTRLIKHYGHIVRDIDRVQLGYELIKLLDKVTEDRPEADYYHLLEQAFAALDDETVSPELIHVWFEAQLLRLAGHAPNLTNDASGAKLAPDLKYNFDATDMFFINHLEGRYSADEIKILRLLFADRNIKSLIKIQGLDNLLSRQVAPLMEVMLNTHLKAGHIA